MIGNCGRAGIGNCLILFNNVSQNHDIDYISKIETTYSLDTTRKSRLRFTSNGIILVTPQCIHVAS
jgi:hypothetical protein